MQISRKQNKILGQIPDPLTDHGQVTIYLDYKLEKVAEVVDVKLINGSFELADKFVANRIFVKLVVGFQTYLGATRHVNLATLYNLRDIGGYEGPLGMIKWGWLYRSDALDHLSLSDRNFLEKLPIETVIDLRSQKEIKQNPDQNIGEHDYFAIDPAAAVAAEASKIPTGKNHDQQKVEAFEKLAQTEAGRQKLKGMQQQMLIQMHDMVTQPTSQESYAKFLRVILSSSGPVIYHCQGGKDRTGWGTVLLLGLLGIDDETIMADYLMTKKYNAPRNAKRMQIYKQFTNNEFVLDYLHSLQLATEEYLNSALAALNQLASSYEDYAKRYLDFSSQDIENLRLKYLMK
ncbi:tyrosine-protein phosphatase [Xylocopilactobacillus apicola]|uniref:Protein-tyrosine-phosphatase n=1 Tax=Xylocopilactobacillus apicola TaxID=2932184 RepID=A0AAU9D1K3_9LACO|nr:tyrosine-protein phosphatase [Xylocopilactobacillus apicola]BDR57594.1 protein-tyrosine-phosphatase [Xylocopilactobacillus apicola]